MNLNLLVDTQIVIGTLHEPERMDAETLELLADPANTVFVSAFSVFEIVIKMSVGKLKMPPGWIEAIEEQGMTYLSFQHRHASAVEGLPLHHRDPFDRALIAQAMAEGMTLVTSDRAVLAYQNLVRVRAVRPGPGGTV